MSLIASRIKSQTVLNEYFRFRRHRTMREKEVKSSLLPGGGSLTVNKTQFVELEHQDDGSKTTGEKSPVESVMKVHQLEAEKPPADVSNPPKSELVLDKLAIGSLFCGGLHRDPDQAAKNVIDCILLLKRRDVQSLRLSPEGLSVVRVLIKSIILVFLTFSTPTYLRGFEEKNGRTFWNFVEHFGSLYVKLSLVHVDSYSYAQTYLAYMNDSLLCRSFGEVRMPKKPNFVFPRIFYCGWSKNFIRRQLSKNDSGSLSFFYSLQKGTKQSWPVINDRKRYEALQKHAAAAIGPDIILKKDFVDDLSSTAHGLFRQLNSLSFTSFSPNDHSTKEVTSRKGGGLSSLDRCPHLHHKWRSTIENDDPKVPVKAGTGRIWKSPSPKTSNVVSTPMGVLREINSTCNVWREDSFKRILSESESHCDLDAAMIALEEPNKARIIGVLSSHLSQPLLPIKGAWIGLWKKLPQSTMRHDDLTSRVQLLLFWTFYQSHFPQGVSPHYIPIDRYVSADYSSATDLVSRQCSIVVSNCYRGFPGWTYVVKSFEDGGTCSYDKNKFPKTFEPLKPVPYVRGQQMGHGLSFFILCLTNLCCLKTATERWRLSTDVKLRKLVSERRLSHTEATQLSAFHERLCRHIVKTSMINGDDLLFCCPHSNFWTTDLASIFEQVALEVGFEFSVGKNYISDHSIMMNSQAFKKISKPNEPAFFRKCGYLNQRVSLGSVASKKNLNTPLTAAVSLSKMLKDLPRASPFITTLQKRYPVLDKKFHLKGQCFRPNWFIPVHLGGYGLDIRLCEKFEPTPSQLLVATRFLTERNLQLLAACGDELSLNLSTLGGIVGKLSIVKKGDQNVLPYPVTRFDDDAWAQRLAYLTTYQNLSSPLSNLAKICAALKNPEKGYWCEPMSIEKMVEFWNVDLLFPTPPPCPPLNPLRYDDVVCASFLHSWRDGPMPKKCVCSCEYHGVFGLGCPSD